MARSQFFGCPILRDFFALDLVSLMAALHVVILAVLQHTIITNTITVGDIIIEVRYLLLDNAAIATVCHSRRPSPTNSRCGHVAVHFEIPSSIVILIHCFLCYSYDFINAIKPCLNQ